jgi:signal transduction histidine kinase
MTPLRAAARVAAITTLVGAFLYAGVCAGLILISQANTMHAVDRQLNARLGFLRSDRARQVVPQRDLVFPYQLHRPIAPEYAWQVDAGGKVARSSQNAPSLPASWRHVSAPTTVTLDGVDYRLNGGGFRGGWLVVGSSLTFAGQERTALVTAEALAFLPVMAVIFGVALLIGRGGAEPIEKARRHLLDFTGDASHELRTPLQLVEAELSLALRRTRDADSYRHSLERISRETAHMRQLVDDLLWLARFDSRAGEELPAPVDLVEAAARSVERFDRIATRRSQDLSLSVPDTPPPAVVAPESWIYRVLAVLIDNACRYTPEGGSIVVAVGQVEDRPWLTVEDSGPGIPPAERQRIFDRFHRATSVPGGSGLGLAIADAIVEATTARWHVEESGLGGARFTISWPPVRARSRPAAVQVWTGPEQAGVRPHL